MHGTPPGVAPAYTVMLCQAGEAQLRCAVGGPRHGLTAAGKGSHLVHTVRPSSCLCWPLRPPGWWQCRSLERCGPGAGGREQGRPTLTVAPISLPKPQPMATPAVHPGGLPRRHPSQGSQQGAEREGASQGDSWMAGFGGMRPRGGTIVGDTGGVLCAAGGPSSSGLPASQRRTPRGEPSGAVGGF